MASAVAKLADHFASAAEHYPAEDWVLDAVEVNAERLLDANQALQIQSSPERCGRPVRSDIYTPWDCSHDSTENIPFGDIEQISVVAPSRPLVRLRPRRSAASAQYALSSLR